LQAASNPGRPLDVYLRSARGLGVERIDGDFKPARYPIVLGDRRG
jgi:hypothetical protein